VNPGEVALAGVNPPAFRQVLDSIPIGKPTQPLVARDGIAVITVCTRDQKNIGAVTEKEIEQRLVNERIDMLSRQTMRELRRKATIDQRDHGV
jgi:peptidyl-prolyl cis-trans isomerase SurA